MADNTLGMNVKGIGDVKALDQALRSLHATTQQLSQSSGELGAGITKAVGGVSSPLQGLAQARTEYANMAPQLDAQRRLAGDSAKAFDVWSQSITDNARAIGRSVGEYGALRRELIGLGNAADTANRQFLNFARTSGMSTTQSNQMLGGMATSGAFSDQKSANGAYSQMGFSDNASGRFQLQLADALSKSVINGMKVTMPELLGGIVSMQSQASQGGVKSNDAGNLGILTAFNRTGNTALWGERGANVAQGINQASQEGGSLNALRIMQLQKAHPGEDYWQTQYRAEENMSPDEMKDLIGTYRDQFTGPDGKTNDYAVAAAMKGNIPGVTNQHAAMGVLDAQKMMTQYDFNDPKYGQFSKLLGNLTTGGAEYVDVGTKLISDQYTDKNGQFDFSAFNNAFNDASGRNIKGYSPGHALTKEQALENLLTEGAPEASKNVARAAEDQRNQQSNNYTEAASKMAQAAVEVDKFNTALSETTKNMANIADKGGVPGQRALGMGGLATGIAGGAWDGIKNMAVAGLVLNNIPGGASLIRKFGSKIPGPIGRGVAKVFADKAAKGVSGGAIRRIGGRVAGTPKIPNVPNATTSLIPTIPAGSRGLESLLSTKGAGWGKTLGMAGVALSLAELGNSGIVPGSHTFAEGEDNAITALLHGHGKQALRDFMSVDGKTSFLDGRALLDGGNTTQTSAPTSEAVRASVGGNSYGGVGEGQYGTPVASGASTDPYSRTAAATEAILAESKTSNTLLQRIIDITGRSGAVATDASFQARYGAVARPLSYTPSGSSSGLPTGGSTSTSASSSGSGRATGSAGASYGGGGNAASVMFGGSPPPITQEFGHTDYADGGEYDSWIGEFGLSPGQHPGIDYGAPVGTKVFSPVAGEVITAGGTNNYYDDSIGKGVAATGELKIGIPDKDGDNLILGHLSKIYVKIGDKVKAGDLVALSGTANGAHVHVEYRKKDSSTRSGFRIVDPRGALPNVAPSSSVPGSQTGTGSGGAGGGTADSPAYVPSAADNQGLSGDAIDNWIRQTRPDSPLIGYGQHILDYANKNNVSVPQALGIFLKESGLGTNVGRGNLSGLGGENGFQNVGADWGTQIDSAIDNLGSKTYQGGSLQQQTGLWFVGDKNASSGAVDSTGGANGNVGDYVDLILKVFQQLSGARNNVTASTVPPDVMNMLSTGAAGDVSARLGLGGQGADGGGNAISFEPLTVNVTYPDGTVVQSQLTLTSKDIYTNLRNFGVRPGA